MDWLLYYLILNNFTLYKGVKKKIICGAPNNFVFNENFCI